MTAVAQSQRPQLLRVAAVWGTTVLGTKVLERGDSLVLGQGDPGALPMPDGIDMPQTPVRAAQGGWEIDARGTVAGILRLRGRDEDPVAVGRTGAHVTIMPGDFGLLQYGLFSIFFQYSSPGKTIKSGYSTDLLTSLSIFSSIVFHIGIFGFVFLTNTPDPIPKPGELDLAELAERFGLRRAELEPPPPPAPGDKEGGGSGVKDPGAHDKKKQGGGQKMAGAEGKLGLNGKEKNTELQGDIKPATALGGLSEVLNGETGEQIKSTLQTINTVANALSGLNSANLVLGGGPGTSLKGGGSGGGGTGAGVAFGSGTLNTGWGAGTGGGYGAGGGGPGGRGAGGFGRGGTGGGTGTGSGPGAGPGEAKVTGGNGMSARGGLSPDQVLRVVMAHKGAVRACYESEAQRNPSLKGGIVLSWQILPDGSVSSPALASSTLNNSRVEGCVVRQLRGWHFPASESQTIVPSFPFSFAL
jgi:hypothetical protein